MEGPTLSPKQSASTVSEGNAPKRSRWTLGILRDHLTDEVPGSVVLLSKQSEYNAPLGLQSAPPRVSVSSLPSVLPQALQSPAMFSRPPPSPTIPEKKRTRNGKIILDPQPEESPNDPLNWPALRRDVALISLGLYCMVGGGMTPVLAAGFTNVADTYDVSIPQVALTTGLYMMGLGLGSVVFSPTAIMFGKRPVYLATCCLFLLTAVWCALSPNYASLVVARVVMGFAVSPVECLPSATIAEIFFLHERAYRLGIYTLLLLGGKNLVPLVSAAVIQSLGWRWVFWLVAIVVGFCGFLLFFFVPETFWDRTPRPHRHHHGSFINTLRRIASPRSPSSRRDFRDTAQEEEQHEELGRSLQVPQPVSISGAIATRRRDKHAHFAASTRNSNENIESCQIPNANQTGTMDKEKEQSAMPEKAYPLPAEESAAVSEDRVTEDFRRVSTHDRVHDYFGVSPPQDQEIEGHTDAQEDKFQSLAAVASPPMHYTNYYRAQPPKTFAQTLRPYSGRLNNANWFRIAFRPFILFAYPAILWSTAVYALSVGWLIVLSESVSSIYRNKATYNFSALGTGLVYISPFIGGVLGTAVAGKVSDILVRYMSRRNGGVYEPEFRLIMAIPVALSTTIGLMGFGWSAQEHDNFFVPTIFFGIISFGCTLGSTTAITFAVDSYRQYAGEALVTLNFSKNILHGLVFSLFFNRWLEADGAKDVFLALGGIQIGVLLMTIPMYIYGKRARMWTVRKNMVEKF